jgi:hypothetical protein
MNKTETNFSQRLELRRLAGEIKSWKFEAIRLKWGESEQGAMHYKADFCIFELDGTITLAEVKNRQIWDRDRVRFRGCRAEWGHIYRFQFWQLNSGTWKQLE